MMVTGFHAGAQEIAAAASGHGAAAGGMTDVAACRADETSYDGVVRPMVEQMRAIASPMDENMTSMGGQAASADMQCGADAMRWELDRHASLACASTGDMAPNRTEAARHVQAMTRWTRPPAGPLRADGLDDGHGWDVRRRHDRDLPAERRRVVHALWRRGDDAVSADLGAHPKKKDQPMTRALLVPVILAFAGTACMHAGHAAPAAATQPSTVAPAARNGRRVSDERSGNEALGGGHFHGRGDHVHDDP